MAKETMSSEERLWTAIRLEKPDRVPVDPLISVDPLAHLSDTLSGRLYADPGLALEAMVKLYDRYRFEILELMVPFTMDAWYFTDPLEPKFPGRDLPDNYVFQVVEKELIKRSDYELIAENGWNKFLLEDYIFRIGPHLRPQDLPRMIQSNQEYASKCLKEWKKHGVRVLSSLSQPYHPFFRLSVSRSLIKFTEDLYYEPELVEPAMKRMTRDTIRDLIDECKAMNVKVAKVVEERASCFYYPLKIYERFWWPYTEQIVNALWSEGIVTHFHLDTPWDKNLAYFKKLPKGSCILRFDGTTDIFAAKETLHDHQCLEGDVHPSLLSLGTPEQVEAYCKKLIDKVGGDGGFILSSGCCLPPDIKPENFQAMIDTCKTYELSKN
jgi:hypothetical protein